MEPWLEFSVPGSVVLLMIVGIYETRRRERRPHQGPELAATYVNEFTAIWYGSKRMELDHRDSMSMMREEDAQGAPPNGVDLDRGVVVLRPDGTGLGR
jgi:hypothetical protein